MSYFLSAINGIKFDLGGDSDGADKLCCRYSVILLVMFSVVVSTKQYVGEPIKCWVPGTFTLYMRYYVDDLCWIKNTYYVPLEDRIPNRDEDLTKDIMINYYQWVPIILILQALMFYLPHMIWMKLNRKNGCELKHIVKLLTGSSVVNTEVRDKSVRYVTEHLDRFMRTRERPKRLNPVINTILNKICIGRTYGNRMIAAYFLVKLLYLTSIGVQFYMLVTLIGEGYVSYGWKVLENQFKIHAPKSVGEYVDSDSRIFPKTTLCSFYIREFGGNTHRYTVQCVMPINIFNEKIYVFLWFWLIFVALSSVHSLVCWVWESSSITRVNYLKRFIKMAPESSYKREEDMKIIRKFAHSYLQLDGVFLLRLLERNISEVVICEVIDNLYYGYKEIYKKERQLEVEAEISEEENESLTQNTKINPGNYQLERRAPIKDL